MKRVGAVLLAVASASVIAACSSGSSIPQEPLQPGTAPAVTSHVVPSSPAAAARRAASETASSARSATSPKATTTKASPPKASPPKATPTVTGVIKGGQFCSTSAHGAIGLDSDGRKYVCSLASGVWQWRELPMVEQQTSTTKAPSTTTKPPVTTTSQTTKTPSTSASPTTSGGAG